MVIRFVAESAGIYAGVRLCLRLRLFSSGELKEFAVFCGCMLLLLLVSRAMPRLRETVVSWGERSKDGQT